MSRYMPALSFKWLTPLYDPLLKWGMREEIFKRQLISLLVPHLASENKVRAFQEFRRVLRPGGLFHMVDFGAPRNLDERALALFDTCLEEAEDNARGVLPGMLQSVGLLQVEETFHLTTIFGPLSLLRAIKGE